MPSAGARRARGGRGDLAESSVVSPASEQPGSSQSVWPSRSLSRSSSHGALGAGGRRRGRRRGRRGRGTAGPRGRAARPGDRPAGRGRRAARRGSARPRRARARLSTSAAPAGAVLPHSFAASTGRRAPSCRPVPFNRLPSSAPRSAQPGALPAVERRRERLDALQPCPRSVNTTLPDAATPRGRTTATASRPCLTPPATVTPAGRGLRPSPPLAPPTRRATDTWPSARHGHREPLGRMRGGRGYQEHGQRQEGKGARAGSMRPKLRPGSAERIGVLR